MRDRNRGKYEKMFKREIKLLNTWSLADSVEILDIDYQVCKVKSSDSVFIFYPHKTSAGHIHLRVRVEKEGSYREVKNALISLVKHFKKDWRAHLSAHINTTSKYSVRMI